MKTVFKIVFMLIVLWIELPQVAFSQPIEMKHIAWNPTQNLLAMSNGNTLTIMDGNSMQIINALNNLPDTINSFSWSSSGTQIVLGMQADIRVWTNPLSGSNLISLESTYPGETDRRKTLPVNSFSWNLDDTLIAGAVGQALLIWDVSTQQVIAERNQDWSFVNQVIWLSNELVAVTNQDSTVYIVDALTAQIVKFMFLIPTKIQSFKGITVNSDRTSLAVGWDEGIVFVWDHNEAPLGATEGANRRLGIYQAHDDDVWSLDWSPNDLYIATGSQDGTAKIWNAQTGELLQTIAVAPVGTLVDVSWSLDGSKLAYIADTITAPIVIQPNLPTPTPSPTPIACTASSTSSHMTGNFSLCPTKLLFQ